MSEARAAARCGRLVGVVLAVLVATLAPSRAQDATDAVAGDATNGPRASSSFAVVGSSSDDERAAAALLHAVDAGAARPVVDFVVHFDVSSPSDASCGDAALARRRALLDAAGRPVVPVVAASGWAACGAAPSDPTERLERIGDTFFAGDESAGGARLRWLRQSAVPRFHRYRENVRWQVGRVLYATVNLPANNNNFRFGAGRNGEFEERQVANRAWLARTVRFATERRLAGIVLFVDAAPGFAKAMRAPDLRASERDGYYEWKLALREFVPTFKGQVLMVQSRDPRGAARPPGIDHPLNDAAGRTVENFARIALPDRSAVPHWLRIDVDSRSASVFAASVERVFDDPSGELYGPSGPRLEP